MSFKEKNSLEKRKTEAKHIVAFFVFVYKILPTSCEIMFFQRRLKIQKVLFYESKTILLLCLHGTILPPFLEAPGPSF